MSVLLGKSDVLVSQPHSLDPDGSAKAPAQVTQRLNLAASRLSRPLRNLLMTTTDALLPSSMPRSGNTSLILFT